MGPGRRLCGQGRALDQGTRDVKTSPLFWTLASHWGIAAATMLAPKEGMYLGSALSLDPATVLPSPRQS